MADETVLAQEAPQAPADSRFRYFLFGILALTFLLYLSPFLLIHLPRVGPLFHHDLDYAFERSGTNADIVILGESSALAGADPVIINSDLHLKAVNLPNTFGNLVINGDIELQHYLRNNKRPQLIVFYLSPWNLNYKKESALAKVFEGEGMLLRHGSGHEIWTYAHTNALSFLEFPFRYYASVILPMKVKTLFQPTPESETTKHLGFVPNLAEPPIASPCAFPAELRFHGTETAREMLDHYRGAADHVMVYVAPIPACTGAQAILDIPYSNIPAAAPRTLPPGDFSDDGYFVHIRAPIAPQSTALLADAIRQVLPPSPDQSGSTAQAAP